ncbi:Hypothetical protein D9617_6g093770 [Elsinoe fawcettii]|nr:Hypothetical protein D9617_6g093770 [Elsinoe fawcettii]
MNLGWTHRACQAKSIFRCQTCLFSTRRITVVGRRKRDTAAVSKPKGTKRSISKIGGGQVETTSVSSTVSGSDDHQSAESRIPRALRDPGDKSSDRSLPTSSQSQSIQSKERYAAITRQFFDRLAQVETKQLSELLATLETDNNKIQQLRETPQSLALRPHSRAAKAGYVPVEVRDLHEAFAKTATKFSDTSQNLRVHIQDLSKEARQTWDPSEAPDLGDMTLEEIQKKEAVAHAEVQRLLGKLRARVMPGSEAKKKLFEGVNPRRQNSRRDTKIEADSHKGMKVVGAAPAAGEPDQDGSIRTEEQLVTDAKGRGSDAAEIEAIDQLFRLKVEDVVEDEALPDDVAAESPKEEAEILFEDSPTY